MTEIAPVDAERMRVMLGMSKVGPDKKEWNRILDKYIMGQGISEIDNAALDERQSWMLKELDKSESRIKRLQDKENLYGQE